MPRTRTRTTKDAPEEFKRLRLLDWSDIELLEKVNDVADDEGWADPDVLKDRLGLDHKQARQCIGARYGYMRRKGMIERRDEDSFISVTVIGQAIIDGRINKTTQRMLDGLKTGDRIRVLRSLARETTRLGDAPRTVMRREWRREAEMRRNGGG